MQLCSSYSGDTTVSFVRKSPQRREKCTAWYAAIGHQDSSSPQSQVQPSALKLCLDISLKAWPLRRGLSILKQSSESPTVAHRSLWTHTGWKDKIDSQYSHSISGRHVKSKQKPQRKRVVLCSWQCFIVYVKRPDNLKSLTSAPRNWRNTHQRPHKSI